MARTRIVLQARTTSSRLPAKSLLPIGGMPLAVLCAKRLASSGIDVVLATSDDSSDDVLAGTASGAALSVFRGSLNNVLERFIRCIEDLGDQDIVVRATADNPVPDGAFVHSLIALYAASGREYFATTSPDDGLPYGLSAEIFSAGALRRVARSSHDALDFENVTTTLRRRAGSAGIVPKHAFFQEDWSHLRATVDTLDDYLAMAAVFDSVPTPVAQDWKSLVPRLPATAESSQRRSAAAARPLGTTMALGTAQLGMQYGVTNRTGRPGDAEAAEMLAFAVRSGITHLDTARAYGDAEARIGNLLAPGAPLKIMTKLEPLTALPDDAPAREVRSAVDASIFGSCRDLRRHVLDIVLFHRSADMFRWNGAAIDRLQELRERGVVGALGASVYTPEEAAKCLSDPRIAHLQIPLNLFDGRWTREPFTAARVRRPEVEVHARSVFLQGLLVNPAPAWPAWIEQREALARDIQGLASDLGCKGAADLCIAYVRSFPWVGTVVLGAETLAQTRELMMLASRPALSSKNAQAVRARFSTVPTRLLDPSHWSPAR